MDSKIWILHVCNRLSVGGVQAFLMNYYRAIDKNLFQFAFAVQRNEELPYDKEIEQMGGRIHYLPRMSEGGIRYAYYLNRLLKEHPEYRIIHAHMNQRNAIPLLVAKAMGIPNRISHAHNTSNCSTLVQHLRYDWFKCLIDCTGTCFFACSQSANECLHNTRRRQTKIVPNAIDVSKYSFSEQIRSRIRNQLGIKNDEIVIGHVGNFSEQKNTEYLVKLIKILPQQYKLLLVGDGARRQAIIEKCKNSNLQDRVVFTGVVSSSEMYQAMDIFVFPSKFEGLGMVAIEAIASGLPVIASTGVPKDIDITDSVVHLPANDSCLDLWKSCIIDVPRINRKDGVHQVREAGYDISIAARKLEEMYKIMTDGKIENE